MNNFIMLEKLRKIEEKLHFTYIRKVKEKFVLLGCVCVWCLWEKRKKKRGGKIKAQIIQKEKKKKRVSEKCGANAISFC